MEHFIRSRLELKVQCFYSLGTLELDLSSLTEGLLADESLFSLPTERRSLITASSFSIDKVSNIFKNSSLPSAN